MCFKLVYCIADDGIHVHVLIYHNKCDPMHPFVGEHSTTAHYIICVQVLPIKVIIALLYIICYLVYGRYGSIHVKHQWLSIDIIVMVTMIAAFFTTYN